MKIAVRLLGSAGLFLLSGCLVAQTPPKNLQLEFAPSQTTVHFTLGATLHSVHGEFRLKQGSIRFNPDDNAINGMIVVDTGSGQSGNDRRDRRMHTEILESARYPEITFLPDRVEGTLAAQGASDLRVHGTFAIHGGEHEMTVPVHVELAPGHWTASAHFSIPYVEWGIKNPSTFILRVDRSVEIDVQASGSSPVSSAATK